jgi:ATP-dependent DNA ligase
LFDCLGLSGTSLADAPLSVRRDALVGFQRTARSPMLLLSPATTDMEQARAWLGRSGGALDGVIAKRIDQTYRAGERAMIKVKQLRTADCVVGGYRERGKGMVGSLLLGLYDGGGRLDHVGFAASFTTADRRALADKLAPYRGGQGFTGDRPGGPSRWNRGAEKPWIALKPELVVEVIYDQVTDGRFRHGTRFHRWRPDKAPRQCDRSQLIRELRPSELADLAAIRP